MNMDELKSFEGHKRVLLLQSQDPVHLNNQRELFDRSPKEYQSRDLVICSGLEDDILEKYGMYSEFDLILLGKDAGIKYTAHGVSDPKKIYAIIDRLPERQLDSSSSPF
ncbi:MAG: DUF4174 domain-containing protein [Bacteriovoracaceae bacterium]